ncbi:MAG: hemolysin family protein [Melioribacteraceae bacterium]|nr:hemolysin family protein [Melioribacteraceae bacterium]
MTLLILYLAIAIFFSFLCSMLEAIILSSNSTFIEIKLEEGKKYAAKLKRLKENIDQPLAAILTLNTFAHTIGAAGVGAQAQLIWGDEYLSVVSVVLTLLILFFSEIIPKTIGATYWQELIPFATYAIRWMIFILYPFVFISQQLARITGKGSEETFFSRNDFSIMAKISSKKGVLNKDESKMLIHLIDFNKILVKKILTPRTVVQSVSEDITVEQFHKMFETKIFSRIPVYKAHRENITGYILKDEVLLEMIERNYSKKLVELKREITIVFENYPVSKLFKDMIDNKEQIALVIDEHGGMEGIVTMEDIIETLLGLEIVDETDTYKDMRFLANRIWNEKRLQQGD